MLNESVNSFPRATSAHFTDLLSDLVTRLITIFKLPLILGRFTILSWGQRDCLLACRIAFLTSQYSHS
uniref:Uncharacterized protein n=1 Tax=Utricularia reniformis TaxID=192314 RepID=A0A1Y0B1B7_9LAMI|nr:hypothetical protein AEK19_MT0955 [Utricularia reniformis]ART31181.1 hypothetical protein AEK19_MT0955 [Utricularia reniformis]